MYLTPWLLHYVPSGTGPQVRLIAKVGNPVFVCAPPQKPSFMSEVYFIFQGSVHTNSITRFGTLSSTEWYTFETPKFNFADAGGQNTQIKKSSIFYLFCWGRRYREHLSSTSGTSLTPFLDLPISSDNSWIVAHTPFYPKLVPIGRPVKAIFSTISIPEGLTIPPKLNGFHPGKLYHVHLIAVVAGQLLFFVYLFSLCQSSARAPLKRSQNLSQTGLRFWRTCIYAYVITPILGMP